jgi:hypothetical protein
VWDTERILCRWARGFLEREEITMTQLCEPTAFLEHLRTDRSPFVVRRTAAAPQWEDAELHAAFCDGDPEVYALCALAEKVPPAQQARVLFQLLAGSRSGLPAGLRRTLERVTARLLTALESDQVLKVFLALRRTRANHKHAARAVLRYVLNHPRLEELAARRRPALRDCLEHALGKNVARACVRLLTEADGAESYARRRLLRFAADPERVRAVVGFVYGKAPCPPARAEDNAALVAVPPAKELARHAAERPRTITATNRGDIAATLVHVYRGGANAELNAALERYVADAAERLPRFDGSVALVLDASGSTLGYGEREFCCVSQSQALRLALERCCADLRVIPVGGRGNPPRPEGDTDLAGALLDAVEGDPDVVAIVSDGYENVLAGDLARVVASLPAAGVRTPVVFCHSKFTGKDDLGLRRPAPALPELEFWHEADFAELLWSLFARARGPKGEAFVRDHLRRRLLALEREGPAWIHG